jgi:hypothetical protein
LQEGACRTVDSGPDVGIKRKIVVCLDKSVKGRVTPVQGENTITVNNYTSALRHCLNARENDPLGAISAEQLSSRQSHLLTPKMTISCNWFYPGNYKNAVVTAKKDAPAGGGDVKRISPPEMLYDARGTWGTPPTNTMMLSDGVGTTGADVTKSINVKVF